MDIIVKHPRNNENEDYKPLPLKLFTMMDHMRDEKMGSLYNALGYYIFFDFHN